MSIADQSVVGVMDIESYDENDVRRRIVHIARQTGKTSLLERMMEESENLEGMFLSLEMPHEKVRKRMMEMCVDTPNHIDSPVDEENTMLRRRDLNVGKLPSEVTQESASHASPPISKEDLEKLRSAKVKRDRKNAKRKQQMTQSQQRDA